MDKVDLSNVADELLKDPYAKHLIREEANRQIESWIKWRITPTIAILAAVAGFLAWKESAISKKVSAVEDKIESANQKADQTKREADHSLTEICHRLADAKNLTETAGEGAELGNQAITETQQTLVRSFGVVNGTGRNVAEMNHALPNIGDTIAEANRALKAFSDQQDKIESGLRVSSEKADKLEEEQRSVSGEAEEFKVAIEKIMPALRMRVFHEQLLRTGRITNNVVVFGDSDGERGLWMKLKS
jgi:chromosome segregation ATPase